MAPQSCSCGCSGNSRPVCLRMMSSKRVTRSARSAADSSASEATPLSFRFAVRALSKSSFPVSRTTSPYIWRKRRRQSSAKRSPAAAARPLIVARFKPRFRIVSIIPGIEERAPERTETSSGLAASPKRLPVAASTFFSASATSRFRSSWPASFAYPALTAASIVKPGGTGMPSAVISARPEPLPPRRSLPRPAPSAWPLPKKNTRFILFPSPRRSRKSRRTARILSESMPGGQGGCPAGPPPGS